MGFCLNCCKFYCFFSYAAASIIYFIIAIFASTGNVAVLVEHMIIDNNSSEEEKKSEKEEVKKRTIIQYFVGSAASLVIALILFIFCILKPGKNKGGEVYQPTIQKIIQGDDPNIIDEIKNNNIMNNRTENMPIEMAIDSNNKIISDYSSSNTEEGMKETIN